MATFSVCSVYMTISSSFHGYSSHPGPEYVQCIQLQVKEVILEHLLESINFLVVHQGTKSNIAHCF